MGWRGTAIFNEENTMEFKIDRRTLLKAGAAVAAARRWKFNPETRDGRKVASRVRVPVDFTLR